MKDEHLMVYLLNCTRQEKIELLGLMQRVKETAGNKDIEEMADQIIYNILDHVFPGYNKIRQQLSEMGNQWKR